MIKNKKKELITILEKTYISISTNNLNIKILEKNIENLNMSNSSKISTILEFIEISKKNLEKNFLIFLLKFEKNLFLKKEDFSEIYKKMIKFKLSLINDDNINSKIIFNELFFFLNKNFFENSNYFFVIKNEIILKLEKIFENNENFFSEILKLIDLLVKQDKIIFLENYFEKILYDLSFFNIFEKNNENNFGNFQIEKKKNLEKNFFL